MSQAQQPKKVPVWANFLCGGAAACWAEVMTIPLDTCKVRLQIQGEGLKAGAAKKYNNMFHAFGVIIGEEGPLALWKGLVPGLLRQSIFATLRIGLYQPVRDFYHPQGGDPPLYKKIAAGLTTGTIGISIASPTDLVKIRQAEGKKKPGEARRYNGTIDAFTKIYKNEGVKGFWKGVGPNIVRNSIINAAELATYDQVKQTILNNKWLQDGVPCHLLCGTTAGFVATCVGSPADVLKTRIMNQVIQPDGSKQYKNAFDCIGKVMKNEGFGAFYKGFWPNFARIGTWNIVMFLTFEQLKKQVAAMT